MTEKGEAADLRADEREELGKRIQRLSEHLHDAINHLEHEKLTGHVLQAYYAIQGASAVLHEIDSANQEPPWAGVAWGTYTTTQSPS